MRKYIIGIFIGFCLSFAVGAHAEVFSMINKVVDGTFAVKVGDKTLETPAITIEGTSYLPVREFGEATGYTVTFDADMGIKMTPKPVTQQPFKPKPQLPVQYFSHLYALGVINNNINVEYIEIDGNQYAGLSAFGTIYFVNWDNSKSTAIFSDKNENKLNVIVDSQYSLNVDGFQYKGTSYVKLSALGLKSHVEGDTLYIERK